MIYFLRAGDTDLCKIGWTNNVARRVAVLQAGNHLRLTVIRQVEGGRGSEAWLHNHFRRYRVEREWYRFHPDMLTVEPGYLPRYRQPQPFRYPDASGLDRAIEKFGGIERMAEMLGTTTVGMIENWREWPHRFNGHNVRHICKVAARHGIPVSPEDFMRVAA